MNKAIFLDRDGTINKLVSNKAYVCNLDDVKLIYGAKKALRILKDKGFLLIVITNQTGVGAGFYTKEQAELVNNKIENLIGFKFDAIYSCYHSPNDNCLCRKPNTLLVEKAVKDFNIDLSKSFFVGDKDKDILTGKKVGCKTCYVGKSINNENADIYAKNLLDFVKKIEKHM